MNYGKIKPVDVANGTGCRVSVFVSGCPHHCKGCFNPELWDYEAGEEFSDDTFFHIMNLCKPDYIRGMSILGGEPLAPENRFDVSCLCRLFKKYYPDKDVWLWTGYQWEEVKNLPLMPFVDTLVDGQFVEELKDLKLKFRGSSNQRIIDVQKSLKEGAVCLYDFSNC